MMLILSGEGPTDLGACNNAQGVCQPDAYRPGPMAILLDRLLEQKLGYRILDITPASVWFVSETMLAKRAKDKSKRRISLRGSKGPAVETGYFYLNAMMLAEFAQETETACGDSSLAVLFRDADGTRSAARSQWQDKWNSICHGFASRNYPCGVPMLPKPKSEAWLLGLVQGQKGTADCAALEHLSGNDAAPDSAKTQLAQVINGQYSAEQWCEWLEQASIDLRSLETMPAFARFHQQLMAALAQAINRTAAPNPISSH